MSKNTTQKKVEEPVNIPENAEVSAVGLSASKQASKAEQKAAKKAEKGHNANRLENPHATGMSVSQAKEVVKKYGDYKGETPDELKRARDVLSRAK